MAEKRIDRLREILTKAAARDRSCGAPWRRSPPIS